MENPYHCEHENVELRMRTFSNNTTHYVDQCLRCGTQLRAHKWASNRIAQAKLSGPILPFDKQIGDNFSKQILAERQEQRTDEKTEWFAWYSEYLQSPEWQEKRAKVLRRDGHTCQGCLDRRAITAHHLTYAHVGDEFLFELVSVCGRCHERLHDVQGDIAIRATVPQ